MVYRCRKCRCLVATSANVVERESASQAADAAAAFSPWRRGGACGRGAPLPELAGGGADLAVGGSIFVEPLRWMQGIVDSGEVQGKLYCPHCASRLGSFHWAGRQSSGGAWVAPAFQLHLARMDAAAAAPAHAAGAIRTPRVLAAVPAAGPAPAAAASPSSQAPGGEPSASGHATEPDIAAAQLASLGLPDAVEAPWHPFFTHLILDCDGVMVDSERASCEALRRAILQVSRGCPVTPCAYRPQSQAGARAPFLEAATGASWLLVPAGQPARGAAPHSSASPLVRAARQVASFLSGRPP